MQETESVWELRDWLCGVAANVSRRCRRARAGTEEDAAHDVLVRAAERGWTASELRARAAAEVDLALDRQSEAMRKRAARGAAVVVEASVLLAEGGDVAAAADAPALYESFAAADADLVAVAEAVIAGSTYRDLRQQFGSRRSVALTARLKRVAAEWLPGADPTAGRRRRNQPKLCGEAACR